MQAADTLIRMSRRGLSVAQIDRVLEVLARRCQRVHAGNQSELAKELRISQPAIWAIMNRRTPPSRETIEALAKLEGLSVESVLASPRARAADIAREGGIPEAAVSAVLAEPDDESRSVLWWIDQMRAAAVRSERHSTRGAA